MRKLGEAKKHARVVQDIRIYIDSGQVCGRSGIWVQGGGGIHQGSAESLLGCDGDGQADGVCR